MKKLDVVRAWGKILAGKAPSLSIEITRECPLRCPGCYAYDADHLVGTGQTLRTVSDFKGQELVDRVLEIVRQHRPLHLSIVGGEPLVRFRELDILLPQLSVMGIAVQLVTSAVREIPKGWAGIKDLFVVVSIDGLQPEHDARRKPATYERILKNIKGQRINVHCTVTSQTAQREGYYEEFLEFWSAVPEVKRIWMSLFTPQIGAADEEILAPAVRESVIGEFLYLCERFPKLLFPEAVANAYRNPPASPDDCIFAKTTLNLTADLTTRVTPCQFGGSPDCSQCGCMASAGMAAVADHKLFNVLPIRKIYDVSDSIGRSLRRWFLNRSPGPRVHS